MQVGLKEKFPQYNFPVVGVDVAAGSSFGLQADADPLWTKDRETQSHQVRQINSREGQGSATSLHYAFVSAYAILSHIHLWLSGKHSPYLRWHCVLSGGFIWCLVLACDLLSAFYAQDGIFMHVC